MVYLRRYERKNGAAPIIDSGVAKKMDREIRGCAARRRTARIYAPPTLLRLNISSVTRRWFCLTSAGRRA